MEPSFGSWIFASAQNPEAARQGMALFERIGEQFDRAFGHTAATVASAPSPGALAPPLPEASAAIELTAEEQRVAQRTNIDPRLMLLMKQDPSGAVLDAELLRRKAAKVAPQAEASAAIELSSEELRVAQRTGVDPKLVALMKADPSGRELDAELARRRSARKP